VDCSIITSKVAADGREIFLGVTEDGQRGLFEPLNLTVSGRKVDLLRDLRRALQKLAPVDQERRSVLMYRGLVKIGADYYLQLPLEEEVWANWEINGEYKQDLSLKKITAVASTMVQALEDLEKEEEYGFEGFSPLDLVSLGEDRWVVLDPRVRSLLKAYRPKDRLGRLFTPPEIIKGKDWSERSHLYTIGLTLYYFITGVIPFSLEKEERTITAIIREKPLDPRYYRPQIGSSLSAFVLRLLEKEAGRRPDLTQARENVGEFTNLPESALSSSPEEEREFKAKGGQKIKQRDKRRRAYWWWQKLKAPTLVASIVIFFFFLTSRGGYQEVITPQTQPEEVVKYFYQAVADLNDLRLRETLDKGVGKLWDDLVINLRVVYSTRLAYEGKEHKVLLLEDLRISEESDSTEENPVFRSDYTLKVIDGEKYLRQERRDRITLARVKREWRIIGIDSDILGETVEPNE